jgi:outer membrane protein assembly factor BamB
MSPMRGRCWRAVVVALTWITAAQAAPPRVVGWRNDGTGKYPDADPPLTWSSVSRAVNGLRFQSASPIDAAPAGRPMPDGVAREWLVLGPIPFAPDKKIEEEALPNEAQLSPNESDKTAQLAWKKLASDTAYLDFAAIFAKSHDAVAFACTRIYSETAAPLRLNLTSPANFRLFVNGKPAAASPGRLKVTLEKGWNVILLKVLAGESDWYAVPVFHACSPATCEQKGIAWHTPLPGVTPAFYGGGHGLAPPLIVGDRIYVRSEPFDLICLRKTDGKVLWLRRHSFFEAAEATERQSPAYTDAQAVAARLDAINAAFVEGTATEKQLQEKSTLEKNLQKEMKRVAPEKYALTAPPDIGFSGLAPTTDGQYIYVASECGVIACCDLDGVRKWIRVDRQKPIEHGFSSSPLLLDGKLIFCMRDITAFDAVTGEPVWAKPLMPHEGSNPSGLFHGSPVAIRFAGTPIIAVGNGTLLSARDGKTLYEGPDAGKQAVASPVIDGATLYQMSVSSETLLISALPQTLTDPLAVTTRQLAINTTAFPRHYLPWHLSSPLVHEGLAYLVNNAGVLSVVDVATAKIVYQKMLDLDPFQGHNEGAARGIGISPALAGKYIYFIGNNGAALVIEPGRAYKQVAKNKIENLAMPGHWSERQERFCANLVFDETRLYLRGEGGLWAIGP